MRFASCVVCGALLAVLGHVLLGWYLVLPAAAVAGYVVGRRAWVAGLFSVALAWSLMMIYGFLQASGPTLEMMRVMSLLMGDLPPFTTPVVTLAVAVGLGAAGGGMGGALRNISARSGR